MRNMSGSPEPVSPALHTQALILAALAPPVWGVAGLAVSLIFIVPAILVLALSAPMSLVLAPLVLACRSWSNWRWGWLCLPDCFMEPWSWLCPYWLRWPWMCWSWLR